MKITHAQWQADVVQIATIHNWTHLHVRKSIGKQGRWTTSTNLVGFPDLLLWAPGRGFIAAELKVKPDKPKPEQLAVLDSLRDAGAQGYVWYPEDIDEVVAVLGMRKTGDWRKAMGVLKGIGSGEPAEDTIRRGRGG